MPPHESSESDRAARNEPSDRFDAYHSWLAIPPEEQPANHYRLLGINLFESSRQVIGNAADQRMTYLKTFGAGQHSTLSQRLLNEVSAARVCLLSEPKKRAYDDQLRKQTAPRSVTQPPPVPPCPPAGSQPGDFIVNARPPLHPRTSRSIAWAVGVGVATMLFIGGSVISYYLSFGRMPETQGPQKPPEDGAVDSPTEIRPGGLVEKSIDFGVDQAGEDIGGSKGGKAGGEAELADLPSDPDPPTTPTDSAGTEEVGPPEPSGGDESLGGVTAPSPPTGTSLKEAWVQINRGNIEVGRDLLKAAIKEEDSADIRGRFSLGLLDALNAHEWKKAHTQFTVCIRRQPAHVPSLNNLALLNIRLDHTTSAMSNWRAALEVSPQPPEEILYNLARLQHLSVMLSPRDLRLLNQLCETATAGGESLPSISSIDGWSYMGLPASDGPGLGSSNPDDYVDHCCITCDGLGKVRCPNRACAQGTVRDVRVVAINKHVRGVPIRVPCGVCKGQGGVTCPSCKGSGRS